MKKLDRFILMAFVGPFVAILAVVIFVLMMQFLWLYIDELVGKGLGLWVILEFMMWGGCTILPLALPLATLLASVMTLGQMGENNELMAMKGAGVSVSRIMIPIMAASLLISVGAYFAGNYLVPKAFNEIYTLRDDIGKTKSEIKIPSGVFYDGIDGYILRVRSQDKAGGVMRDVMVYDHSSDRGNTSLALADSATLKMSRNKDYLIFTMYSGSSYQENNKMSYRDTTLDLNRVAFDKQELIIPLKNYSYQKSDSVRFSDQIKCLPFRVLKHDSDSLATETGIRRDAHYKEMCSSGVFRKYGQLDTTRLRPSSFFESEDFMEWESDNRELGAYDSAIERCVSLESKAMTFVQDTYEYYYFLRRTDIELLKRVAQAIACLVLFLIGAPLGALIKKGGLGTSAIISVLFFALYWVVDISGQKLARDGAINAWIGVFVSTMVLLPIGVFFTSRAIHDAEIFNVSSLKNSWRIISSKISSVFHKPRIIYMGTPEFAVAPLDALVRSGYKVKAVVTVADKPSGRGLSLNESAVKKYAVSHGIPVLQPLKLKDPGFIAELKSYKADIFVVVAFRMLPEEVWSIPKLGTFNLHAALLPQYRGAAPINWAVINGERLTGVTTFMIDKDIDTGGILLREDCIIRPEDNAGDIHDKLMETGADLVVRTVDGILRKEIETRVQRSFIQGSEVLKPAPKLTRELCNIDWNDKTRSICNLIRGLSPYPAAYTELIRGDERSQIKIYRAEAIQADAAPGTVLTDGKTYFAIATLDGAVSIKELQLSGKKRMDVGAFLLGFREAASWRASVEGTSRAEMERLRA